MKDALLYAYLAGAIDSDGCITVRRSTYAMRIRGDAGAPIFSERVMLKQVTSQIPALLKDAFGGSLRIEHPSTGRGKSLHSWQVTDKQAVACLTALLPYLRIKREQALNCLALREIKDRSKVARVAVGRGHAGGSARPAEMTAAMEAHYAAAKRLNAVGVPA